MFPHFDGRCNTFATTHSDSSTLANHFHARLLWPPLALQLIYWGIPACS